MRNVYVFTALVVTSVCTQAVAQYAEQCYLPHAISSPYYELPCGKFVSRTTPANGGEAYVFPNNASGGYYTVKNHNMTIGLYILDGTGTNWHGPYYVAANSEFEVYTHGMKAWTYLAPSQQPRAARFEIKCVCSRPMKKGKRSHATRPDGGDSTVLLNLPPSNYTIKPEATMEIMTADSTGNFDHFQPVGPGANLRHYITGLKVQNTGGVRTSVKFTVERTGNP